MKLFHKLVSFVTVLVAFALPTVVQGGGDSDCKSIAEIACSTNGFNILCQALEKTGLYDNLNNLNDHFTVFAPGDSAFRDILNDHLHYDDIQHCPLDVLKQILLLHVRVNDVIYKDGLEDRCGDLLRMASGDDTRTVCEHHENYGKKIFQKGGGNSDNGKPKIVTFDIDACNGVIHVVDQVILPSNLPRSSRHPTRQPSPNSNPTRSPTRKPTRQPSYTTRSPTRKPTRRPTGRPTRNPISNGGSESSCSAYSKCASLEGDCCPTSQGTFLECCDGGGGDWKPSSKPTRSPTSDGDNASCSANPVCKSQNLTGDCCPSTDGTFLNCCVEKPFGSCSSNPTCRDLGLRGECCPSESGQFLDCCSDDEPQFGSSYCTYAPKRDCYTSGWPKCCIDDSLECPNEQPECEIGWPIVGNNYCTYSPDYNCYEKGFPSCCLTNDSDDCPENKPFCNVSCDADDRLPSIKDFVCGNNRLEFLCYALNEDLDEINNWLDASGTYTLFAPTDNAFSKLGDDNIRELFDDNAKKLKDVVRYHISDRIYLEYDLTCDQKIDTELGDSSNDFTTTKCEDNEKFQVGNGNDENDRDKRPLIIETNIVTCNGVVHLVDNVILPQKE